MDEIICHTSYLPEGIMRDITFRDILLGGNWVNGKIGCPEKVYAYIGNKNQKLSANIVYIVIV